MYEPQATISSQHLKSLTIQGSTLRPRFPCTSSPISKAPLTTHLLPLLSHPTFKMPDYSGTRRRSSRLLGRQEQQEQQYFDQHPAASDLMAAEQLAHEHQRSRQQLVGNNWVGQESGQQGSGNVTPGQPVAQQGGDFGRSPPFTPSSSLSFPNAVGQQSQSARQNSRQSSPSSREHMSISQVPRERRECPCCHLL